MTAQQQQWFFSNGNDRYGPVGFDYLLELARSGKLDPRNDLVWTSTLSDWEPAGQVEGLFERREIRRDEPSQDSMSGIFASTGDFESTAIPKAHFPGTGRLGYIMGTVVLPIALTILWGLATPLILQRAPVDVQPFVPLAVIPLLCLLVLVTQVKRFWNLGMTGWWVLGLMVPFLNVWLGYRQLACPAGYATTQKLDSIGKLLAFLYWAGVILTVISFGVMMVSAFGEMQESGMLDQIGNQFDDLRSSVLPAE